MTDHDFLSAAVHSIKLSGHAVPASPMRTDRWVARSALQKAIRRGEINVAQSAVLNLVEHDPRAAWRALVIIALEDVGFGSWAALTEVVGLAQSRTRRAKIGHEADLAAYAAKRLAEGSHSQAACDLLMRATNDPAWEEARADAADATATARLDMAASINEPLIKRAVAVLAILNASDGQARGARAHALLELLMGAGPLRNVAEGAWRASGNEMALLLPLVSGAERGAEPVLRDDEILDSGEVGGVPCYALDQFTRAGKQAIKQLIAANYPLRICLEGSSTSPRRWPQLVGDMLFLIDGGALARRLIRWPSEELRLPFRPLLGAFELREGPYALMRAVKAAIPMLNAIRMQAISSTIQAY